MSHLYIKNGYNVTRHSYSAGQDYDSCPRRYQLARVQGWKEKVRRAALEFGNCVESALQHFHKTGCKPGSGVDEFKRQWLDFGPETPAGKELTYSEREGDWNDLYKAGAEMLALYGIKWKSFGYTIPDPKKSFQTSFRKKVFPGSELDDLEYVAYVDLLGVQADGKTPIVVDIKTSGVGLPDPPELLQLDPQLRDYAWVSGFSDIAFLWFQKVKIGDYKKGDQVTFLQGHGDFKPGDTAEVTKGGAKVFIGTVEVPADVLTKQRVLFVKTTVSAEDQREAGELIGRQIVEIESSGRKGLYPKKPGVRFPNNKCPMCSMLPLCLNDEKKIEETLIRPAGVAPLKTSNWVDEI